jgi:hypothetical protein
MSYGTRGKRTGFGQGLWKIAMLLSALTFTAPVLGETFVGIKLGSISLDEAHGSRPKNYALNLGYEFDTLGLNMSIVGEINRTMDKGETRQGDSLEFESDGIYLMLKSSRRVFASLSVGYVENKTITASETRRGYGLALGGGVGVNIGRTRMQLQYTSLADDADFLSLSLDFWL